MREIFTWESWWGCDVCFDSGSLLVEVCDVFLDAHVPVAVQFLCSMLLAEIVHRCAIVFLVVATCISRGIWIYSCVFSGFSHNSNLIYRNHFHLWWTFTQCKSSECECEYEYVCVSELLLHEMTFMKVTTRRTRRRRWGRWDWWRWWRWMSQEHCKTSEWRRSMQRMQEECHDVDSFSLCWRSLLL